MMGLIYRIASTIILSSITLGLPTFVSFLNDGFKISHCVSSIINLTSNEFELS